MIQSGRTQSVRDDLDKWYDRESDKADMVWEWGFHKEALQEMLEKMEIVPFRCFMVRYLLAVHKDRLRPFIAHEAEDVDWMGAAAEEVLQLMEKNEASDYESSPEILKKLTDLVFEDFVSNGFYVPDGTKSPERVRGSVNRGLPTKGKKEIRPILWDKNDLLKKLKAKKLSTDFSKRDECINEDELFALAFGLNMDCGDISFMLKKALRRSDFNLWNWKEFLLYVTYKYAKGDLFRFYQKLKAAYEDETVTPKPARWIKSDDFSTISIRERTDRIAQLIQEENYSVALDENGELPKRMIDYVREYKFLTGHSGDYTRTCQKESARLWNIFRENMREEAEAARKLLHEDRNTAESYAQGKVLIYYEPELGLDVPKETVFYKSDKKYGRRIEFVPEKAMKIPPVFHAQKEVTIELECTQEEPKTPKPEQLYGYIPGKTRFESDNVYLSHMSNKSYFKASAKIPVGERTRITGKITAVCEAGKRIPAGTKFYARNRRGERVEFRSVKDVDALVCEEIWVRCLTAGEEALKGEISECSIPDWRERFRSLENTKIGMKKKTADQAVSGGFLYNYLYQPFQDHYPVKDLPDEKYMDKMAEILEGTQLSSTKLNQIQSKKAEHITRNDILTLSFLAYMSELERRRADRGEEAADDYRLRLSGFMQRTNEVLEKCGYHELYAPNPYDNLIACLLSSSEAIDAYRNLWSWYLTNKRQEGEK